jgi:hypothetical protein
MGTPVLVGKKNAFRTHKREDGQFELIGPSGNVWTKDKSRALVRRMAALCNKAFAKGAFTTYTEKMAADGSLLSCTNCSNVVQTMKGITVGDLCRICNVGHMQMKPPKD